MISVKASKMTSCCCVPLIKEELRRSAHRVQRSRVIGGIERLISVDVYLRNRVSEILQRDKVSQLLSHAADNCNCVPIGESRRREVVETICDPRRDFQLPLACLILEDYPDAIIDVISYGWTATKLTSSPPAYEEFHAPWVRLFQSAIPAFLCSVGEVIDFQTSLQQVLTSERVSSLIAFQDDRALPFQDIEPTSSAAGLEMQSDKDRHAIRLWRAVPLDPNVVVSVTRHHEDAENHEGKWHAVRSLN